MITHDQVEAIRIKIAQALKRHESRITLDSNIVRDEIYRIIKPFLRRQLPDVSWRLESFEYDPISGILTLGYRDLEKDLISLKCAIEEPVQKGHASVSPMLAKECRRSFPIDDTCAEPPLPSPGLPSRIVSQLKSFLPKVVQQRPLWSYFWPRNKVYASVFAPAEVKSGEDMLVQLFLHLAKEAKEAANRAKAVDNDAEKRYYESLPYNIRPGDRVRADFCILRRGSVIHHDSKEVVWQGSITSCTFYYPVAHNIIDSFVGEIGLYIEDVRVSTMTFKVCIKSAPSNTYVSVKNKTYQNVFISYAHQDQEKANKIADVYERQGISYFLDQRSFESGDYIWDVISDRIAHSDAYVLLWTANSQKSPAVAKERQLALTYAYPQVRPREKAPLSIFPYRAEPYAPLPNDMIEYWFEDFDKRF